VKAAAAALGIGAVLLGVGALSAFRGDARAERELASELFTAPVALAGGAEHRLPARATRPAAELGDAHRVLRIGGDGEAEFGRIADVAPSASGDTVYVLDGMSASVSAFGADGRFLFAFGGKGDGPGEFRAPGQLLVLPWSGEVGVWDAQAQRLTVHTPVGEPVRVLAPGAADARGRVRRIRAAAGGYVMEVYADPLQVDAHRQRGALVRLDTAARSPDTLFHFPLAGVPASHHEPVPGSSVTTWLKPPAWSPEPRWDLLADGTVLFAPGGPDHAYRVAPSGAVTRDHRPHRAARVTRRDRLRRLEGQRDRRLLASRETPLAVLEPLNRRFYAAVRPAVTGVLAGPGGALWTRGFETRESWAGFSRTWEAVGVDGRAAGRIRVPAGFEPVRIVDGLLYGIREDDMHVEWVEAYRVAEER
jgi:hypothetical protein